MHLALKIVAIASLTLGLAGVGGIVTTGESFAARTCNSDHPCPAPNPNSGGGTDACVTACTPVASNTNYKDCSDHLADLPRITGREIDDIGQQRVHIAPLCDFSLQALTDQQLHYLQRGNVAGLEADIAGNPVLMAQLTSHGFKPRDVLGILVGSNAAVLYVHKI